MSCESLTHPEPVRLGHLAPILERTESALTVAGFRAGRWRGSVDNLLAYSASR